MKLLKILGIGLGVLAFFIALVQFARFGDRLPPPDWSMDEESIELYLISSATRWDGFDPADARSSSQDWVDFSLWKITQGLSEFEF